MKFKLFLFIFCLVLLAGSAYGPAQECSCSEKREEEPHCSKRVVTLELIPLEGCLCNKEKCSQMSQRFLCLAQGEELVVTLKKPYLNLEDCSEGILVEDRFLVSQEKESFCYWGPLGWCFQWQLERAPFFQCVEKIFGRTDNVYCYKVAQGSGTINLSFISHTYPRYYASLHLHVEKQREEK